MKKNTAFSLIELSIVILIIGILIAGVTQGSRLVGQMRLSSARALTKSSDVASISGLTLWLETSLDESITGTANTVPDNGETIASWNDINPQSSTNKIYYNTSNSRPTYLAAGINGIPSVKFVAASSQYLANSTSIGATAPVSAASKTYTAAVVFRIDNVTGVKVLYSTGSNPAAANRQFNILANVAAFGFGGHANDYTPSTMTALNDYCGIISVNNNNTNNASIYLNTKTASTGASSATAAALNITSSYSMIGGFPDVGPALGYFYGGLISEIIIFDRLLKAEEILAINNYLSKKYAIKLS